LSGTVTVKPNLGMEPLVVDFALKIPSSGIEGSVSPGTWHHPTTLR
jgi:hypothetical protein